LLRKISGGIEAGYIMKLRRKVHGVHVVVEIMEAKLRRGARLSSSQTFYDGKIRKRN
jgi:hypothetical protein